MVFQRPCHIKNLFHNFQIFDCQNCEINKYAVDNKWLTSDSRYTEHEGWCTVQMDGIQQSSTHMHPDAELAVDKGWETASTAKQQHVYC